MVKFEKIMGKFVIFMILAAYVIVVGVVGWSLIESHGVKEVTVEAEVADILGVKERIREGASWDVIYKYSYNGKIYEEEVSGIKSCKQGDKANIVIDSGHPNKVILFTKKEKIVFLSVINGIVAIIVILIIIDNRKMKNH
ncbi:MAG: hypothetical protein ACLUUZ_03105 [Blautia wexlerae]